MAKVDGPLFSLRASGQLAKALVYARSMGRNWVRMFVIPQNPQSAGQVAQRAVFALALQGWQGQNPTEKEDWDDYAESTGYGWSGVNAFMSEYITYYNAEGGDPPLTPPS